MNKILIYIILILICIALFFIYNKYGRKMYGEQFNSFDNGGNIPNFVKNYQNIDFNKPPNYTNENITEYNFKRLFKVIEKINKEKVDLSTRSNYNFYTQSTTDDRLRNNLEMISKYVINILNSDNYYDFNKTNFGDVEVWIDKDGNEEIKYELFLWDKKNYFQVKLWVDIIKFVKGKVDKYGIKDTHYIFNDFNIGWPFKDQLIPLPTQTIPSGNFDIGDSTIKPNNPSEIRDLYLNQIEVQNSTLIVDYFKEKYPFNRLEVSEDGFSGITDMSLDYSIMKNGGDHNPYLEKGEKYNQWPTLDAELKFYPQYPSKKPPQKWNDLGVYYYDNEKNEKLSDRNNIESNDGTTIKYTNLDNLDESETCNNIYHAGTRWSEQKEPLQGQFWVANYVLPKCGEYRPMFDLASGSPQYTSRGGGKM